jgi:dynein heavy chain 1
MEMTVRNPQVDLNTSSTFSYLEPASGTTLVYTLHLPPTPPVSSRLLSTLSLIKKRPTLDATIPIADQLHFVLLSSSSGSTSTSNGNQDATDDQSQNGGSDEAAAPYEGLRSLVHFGVTPWFESYVNSKQGKTVEVSLMSGKKGAEAQTGIYIVISRSDNHAD